MTEAARRISAANLGERIEVANPGDELGRLGATLNAMLDRIDRAFAATRRFTADAAHELKTPLASIRAEAEVALLARRSPEDYEETLRSIVEEAERLARLADRLLAALARGRRRGPRPRDRSGSTRRCGRPTGDAAEAAPRAGLHSASRSCPASWSRATRTCSGRCSTTCSTTRSSTRPPAAW